jgi:hypothetical protein
MSTMMSGDPVSPAVARFLASETKRAKDELEAEALAQRWPMSLDVRGLVIKTALSLCGLEVTSDGAVKKIEGVPLPKPRVRLGAMRVLASYDRLSLQQRKADLLARLGEEEPVRPVVEPRKVSPEVATEALLLLVNAPGAPRFGAPKSGMIQPDGRWRRKADLDIARRAFRQRWPISMAIRGQIIVSALSLCGYAVTCEGEVNPIPPSDEVPPTKARIVLAALRVLAAYDRLSIEEQRVELRVKPSKFKRAHRPDIDPETAAKFHELIESDSKRIE